MTAPGHPHVVILGGGFGGLYCAKALADAPVAITLVDRKNHHVFQPLLYQVATAALDPSDIASPLRQVFAEQENVRVIVGDARAIDAPRRVVRLADSELTYDVLVSGRTALPIADSVIKGMKASLLERAADVYWAGAVRHLVRNEPEVLQ